MEKKVIAKIASVVYKEQQRSRTDDMMADDCLVLSPSVAIVPQRWRRKVPKIKGLPKDGTICKYMN